MKKDIAKETKEFAKIVFRIWRDITKLIAFIAIVGAPLWIIIYVISILW